MSDMFKDTVMYRPDMNKKTVSDEIAYVSAALKEKGYNPIDQLVGYLLSGDPTYITNYKEARTRIRSFERYELLEELVDSYIKNKNAV